jgi:hypothetical protein
MRRLAAYLSALRAVDALVMARFAPFVGAAVEPPPQPTVSDALQHRLHVDEAARERKAELYARFEQRQAADAVTLAQLATDTEQLRAQREEQAVRDAQFAEQRLDAAVVAACKASGVVH